jgi:hypothetical protein
MVRWVSFALVGVIAWVGSAHQQPIGTATLQLASPEIQSFVKQTLEDRVRAGQLPDGHLLGNSLRIGVREEMPRAGVRNGPGSLPRLEGREFYLISQIAAQTEADKTGRAQHFVSVDRPSLEGEVGSVLLGVDVAYPKDLNLIKLCCCTGLGQFRRVQGRWTFVKWIGHACA